MTARARALFSRLAGASHLRQLLEAVVDRRELPEHSGTRAHHCGLVRPVPGRLAAQLPRPQGPCRKRGRARRAASADRHRRPLRLEPQGRRCRFRPRRSLSTRTRSRSTGTNTCCRASKTSSRAASPCSIFVMGENKWRDEDEWPLARANETQLLSSTPSGKANCRMRATVSLSTGDANQGSRRHVCLRSGQSSSDRGRSALLRFRSSGRLDRAIRSDVEARSGRARLFHPAARSRISKSPARSRLISSRSPLLSDTDFTGKLVDVWPNGFAQNLTEGILRARFRAVHRRLNPNSSLRARSTNTRSTSGPRATSF